jgi:hypothetical protein
MLQKAKLSEIPAPNRARKHNISRHNRSLGISVAPDRQSLAQLIEEFTKTERPLKKRQEVSSGHPKTAPQSQSFTTTHDRISGMLRHGL